MHGREAHTFVPIRKVVVIYQRLQQRRCLFADIVVVTRLRTENSRLQCALIEHPVLAAVFLNLVMVDGDDLSNGQIDALGRHFASRLYNSRYFSLERR